MKSKKALSVGMQVGDLFRAKVDLTRETVARVVEAARMPCKPHSTPRLLLEQCEPRVARQPAGGRSA